MEKVSRKKMFEYKCPECGKGIVRDVCIPMYHTHVRGIAYIAKHAIIGICDQCGTENFAPQETKRWEEEFDVAIRKAFEYDGIEDS